MERNYWETVNRNETSLLPLLSDLSNPSPDIGWANGERLSLMKRGPVNAVMALALIQHLAISNNVPIEKVADLFAILSKWLVVEIVPKDDSQVERLLKSREDIFPNYHKDQFKFAFKNNFHVVDMDKVKSSKRYI